MLVAKIAIRNQPIVNNRILNKKWVFRGKKWKEAVTIAFGSMEKVFLLHLLLFFFLLLLSSFLLLCFCFLLFSFLLSLLPSSITSLLSRFPLLPSQRARSCKAHRSPTASATFAARRLLAAELPKAVPIEPKEVICSEQIDFRSRQTEEMISNDDVIKEVRVRSFIIRRKREEY